MKNFLFTVFIFATTIALCACKEERPKNTAIKTLEATQEAVDKILDDANKKAADVEKMFNEQVEQVFDNASEKLKEMEKQLEQ